MAEIVLDGVSRVFPDGTVGVKDLDLVIGDGEFMVFVGPSGSGKSTALRMVAGLEEISAGEIRIAGKVVNDLSPRDRDIAMVFQNYALYPHMTVFENMAFGLKLRKVPGDEVRRRVGEAASMLGIGDFLERKPRQLSGGQRQRVAMGRAIVREPAAFLMDEPLSNLDAKLRVQMRTEIARLHQRLGTTTIYVTHDQVEAVTMADRVAVLRDGELQQADTPRALYDQPVNLFVAGFIGSPAMNMVMASVAGSGTEGSISFGGWSIPIPAKQWKAKGLAPHAGGQVVAGIRPEDFEDREHQPRAASLPVLEVKAALVETLGAETMVYFEVDAPSVDTGVAHPGGDGAGEVFTTFTARLSPRTAAAAGKPLALTVDISRLYFFDPASGKALGR